MARSRSLGIASPFLAKLIKKELLLTFKNIQIIISILIIPILFISMAGSIRYGIETTQHEIERVVAIGIATIVRDNSAIVSSAIEYINSSKGIKIIVVEDNDVRGLLDRYGVVIEIPESFSRDIYVNRLCHVYGYTSISSLSTASIVGRNSIIDYVSSTLCSAMRSIIAQNIGVNISSFDISVSSSKTVFIGDKSFDEGALSRLTTLITMSSLIFSIAIALSFQYGAISIAQEKEERTLEILAVQPISRRDIGISKVIGVLVLALTEASLYIASWMYYLSSIGLANGNIFMGLGAMPIVFLMIDIVIAIVALTVFGLIIGVFARDTRTASIVSTPITLLAILIGTMIQFIGIPLEPLQLSLYSITLIMAPICIMISLMLGYIVSAIGVIIINIAIALLLLYILGKILESEKMFIGIGFMDRFMRFMKRSR
ncbi:ABC-type Na+ efflux pump permease component [Ignisphaera aggregans DSM 17230]|uniref:ABC-type Na+ efflux pump permease component n=1 Tax=Ignisphaera aggregans (strain DSM 17230 / JCM 13409 / AQ1.S1) TaxID=583356 RepID=E0SNH3_IGNAA|nr:ABC-type Na+ efflux pump permease component [Ignisphaera aggregans DSM 17230]